MAGIKFTSAEKLLVCVDESPGSERVIHPAQQMAARRQAKWSAVYVKTPKKLMLSLAERKRAAVQYIADIFDCRVVALLPDDKGKLSVAAGDPAAVIQKDMVKEFNLAHSVYSSGRRAGWGTQTSPTTEILCAPLKAADSILGVLALRPNDPRRSLLPQRLNLLESLSKQVALALEVEILTGKCLPKPEKLDSTS